MPLKIYNTLSQTKEEFQPKEGKRVNLFVCGPTVYDFAHIGHARTYIVFDLVLKYLKQKKYDVFYLQNITDIDDKIINRAKEKNISPRILARKFEREYLKDMKELKVNSVKKYARATDHIKEVINQVERLLKKEYAYKIKDGIYYNISKFKEYGKLSRRTALQAEDSVSRIDESKGKINKGDFCLWKFVPEGQGELEPRWLSNWGKGRPGWHIEDTAITEKYFGSNYDIHGGAKDLIFPHHEAEIAQMEAISGIKPLVKYWIHSGFLTVNGEKMAKSLGNFITIRDFTKEHSARVLRFLIVKTHYRSPIDYNESLVSQAKKELDKIDEFLEEVKKIAKVSRIGEFKKENATQLVLNSLSEFEESMNDDFNTPKAMAAIFNLMNKGNVLMENKKLLKKEAKNILEFLKMTDEIFSFIFSTKKKELVPENIKNLIKEREESRKNNNWQKADEIRDELKKLGWQIKDTKEGPKAKKI